MMETTTTTTTTTMRRSLRTRTKAKANGFISKTFWFLSVTTLLFLLIIDCSQSYYYLQTPSGGFGVNHRHHATATTRNGLLSKIINSSSSSLGSLNNRHAGRTSSRRRQLSSPSSTTTTTSLSAATTTTPDIMMMALADNTVVVGDYSSSSSSLSIYILLAQGLGYLVGVASLILYTPIAFKLIRQQSANGLKMSTWWLKLASYSCSDIYAYRNNYPISTYIETLIITLEAMLILILVAYYQKRINNDNNFVFGLIAYGSFVVGAITIAPNELIAIGQGSSALLNVGALIPQFQLNYQQRTSGDYSPVTAGLATIGCLIRIFTTIQLAGSDPLLLGSFGLAFILNGSLFGQILYYGILVEKKTLIEVLSSDWKTTTTSTSTSTKENTKGNNSKNNRKYLLRRMGSTATATATATTSDASTETTTNMSEMDALLKKEEDMFV